MKRLPLPRAVLFDLDGTLLDNSPLVIEAYFTGMLKLGYTPKNRAFIRSLLGRSTFATGRALGLKEEDLPKIDAYFWAYVGFYVEDPNYLPAVYPNVKEVLEFFFKKSIPLGICTSNKATFAQSFIKKVHLNNYITTYIGSEDVEENKPSPKPLLVALERLGITKLSQKDFSLWYVGDTTPDIEAAHNAGLVSVGVPEKNNYQVVKEKKPDFIFRSMSELYTYLLKF